MREEFNLSEKIKEKRFLDEQDILLTKDVKEFIKRLKEINKEFLLASNREEKIDKLAGGKLNGN